MPKLNLEVITNLGVVVGLCLVAYQVAQTNEGMERQHQHVRSQLGLDDYTNIINREYAVMGDNAAAAIAKARSNPDQLTEEERLIAYAHLNSIYLQISSESYLYQLGAFEFWEETVPVVMNSTYDFPYARDWWKKRRKLQASWNNRLNELLDREFEFED